MTERDRINPRFVLRIAQYFVSPEEAQIFINNIRNTYPGITNAQIFEKATNGKGKPKSAKRKDGKKH